MCTSRIHPTTIEWYRENIEPAKFTDFGTKEGWAQVYSDAVEAYEFTHPGKEYQEALQEWQNRNREIIPNREERLWDSPF